MDDKYAYLVMGILLGFVMAVLAAQFIISSIIPDVPTIKELCRLLVVR